MTVSSSVFQGAQVETDGEVYEDCVFTQCMLIYRGGRMPAFRGCKFIASSFNFEDAAGRTLALLRMMNFGGLKNVVDDAFNLIQVPIGEQHPPHPTPADTKPLVPIEAQPAMQELKSVDTERAK